MSSNAALPLYRHLMKNARRMKDYNFRSYAIRRIKLGFTQNKGLAGEDAAVAIRDGEQQLAMLQRQSTMSQMYPSAKSVME